MNHLATRRAQRGGFAMGLIVGLLIGLALALGVALYIAKVPSPFHDKVPHRTPEQEAAEAEKLKSWDPNAGLSGKPAAPPASRPAAATPAVPAAPPPAPTQAARPPTDAPDSAATPKSSRDAAAILAGEPVPGTAPKIPRPAGDPFLYFVQVGAFSSADDAEQQRAKLALQGFGAKISEREQGGRTIHRVRLGPFDNQAEAAAQQDRLKGLGLDAALVRQERN
jgi:cell division protein FtsN